MRLKWSNGRACASNLPFLAPPLLLSVSLQEEQEWRAGDGLTIGL